MQLEMLRTKIHRARITEADVDYEGSVSIDLDLLEASDILTYEAVHIWNVTNGSRLVTYAIEGVRGSREIKTNGAAALQNRPGDIVIIAAFVRHDVIVQGYEPRVVIVDAANNVTSRKLGTFENIRPRKPAMTFDGGPG